MVYHSAIFSANKYAGIRRVRIDRMGFDSGGKLYVNGPTNDNQPLPSGTIINSKVYNQLASSKYHVISSVGNSSVLYDGITYAAHNVSVGKVTTNHIDIDINGGAKVSDIWLYGDGLAFKSVKATMIINNCYTYVIDNIGTEKNAKLQLPSLSETINSISIDFSSNISLTEVQIVTTN
jgi:hypothetical protein